MSLNAKPSKGTKLMVGDGATPEVFTAMGEVTNITTPDETVEDIDVTDHDSATKQYISTGLAEAGEVSLDLLFVGSSVAQQQLRSDLRAGTRRNYKILLNDAAVDANKTTFAFEAYVKSLPGVAAPQGDALKMSGVTLKLTAQSTVTYAAA